jgi:DNA-binding transcriptional LysR family regulator
MLSMIALGIGIAMVPSFIKLSSDSGLVTVPLYNNDGSVFTDINVQIGVSYKTSNASPLIRAFIDKVENIT